MKKITIELIRSFSPCYDPVTGIADDNSYIVNDGYLTEGYEATVLEFLGHPEVPANDKIWLVLRRDFMSDKALRLFAVWCAREAMKLVDNPDPASINAVDVAERYANGKATEEELNAAKVAALKAANARRDNAPFAAANAAELNEFIAAIAAARAAAAFRMSTLVDAVDRFEADCAAYEAIKQKQLQQLILMIQNPALHEGA